MRSPVGCHKELDKRRLQVKDIWSVKTLHGRRSRATTRIKRLRRTSRSHLMTRTVGTSGTTTS